MSANSHLDKVSSSYLNV